MRKLLLAAALLAGLGSVPAMAAKLQLVEVITSPERTEVLKKMVTAFEAANPGTTVEIVSLPWGQAFEKLLTMVQGGQRPDVVEMPERWLGLYAKRGELESLEPWIKQWPEAQQIADRVWQYGRTVNNTAYMIPYGFYIRAMFYNKKLFDQAGLSGPPATLDDFMTAAQKISAIPGKYGFCLRGAKGGFTGWQYFMLTQMGRPDWFEKDGSSTFNSTGSIQGMQTLIDVYQKGYAPKDSVNWGFNEIVAGFYSGTCAMLDQDPDALIAVAQRMDKDDFAVAPMPKGPSGKSFPSIGYSGWAMFHASQEKEMSWKLISWLSNAENNMTWAKFVGVIPTHKGADKDPAFSGENYAGWFTELNDPSYEMVAVPAHLDKLGYFFDVMSVSTGQEMLLGKRPAKDVAEQWAKYLGDAQKAYLAQTKAQ